MSVGDLRDAARAVERRDRADPWRHAAFAEHEVIPHLDDTNDSFTMGERSRFAALVTDPRGNRDVKTATFCALWQVEGLIEL